MQIISQAFKNVKHRALEDYNNVPDDLEIWTTEYGVKGIYEAGTFTWSSGMRAVALALNYFGMGDKMKLLCFQAIRTDEVINDDLIVGPNGYALALLNKAAMGKTNAISLEFSPNPTFVDDYPSLMGWKFWDDAVSSIVIANFSDQKIDSLNIAKIVNTDSPIHLVQRCSETPWHRYVSEKMGMAETNVTSNSMNISIPPFSVSYIEKSNKRTEKY